MIKFIYNQSKDGFISTLKTKTKQNGFIALINGNKVQIFPDSEQFSTEDNAIPICFHGKLKEENDQTTLKGRITYGFYLYTLVIVAALLIVVRFIWSLSKSQTDNIILCGIVAAVLVVVVIFVNYKARKVKNILLEFLGKLE